MAKSAWEKAIEKQQKEEKKAMENQARVQTASTIANGQPVIGGMRIMDKAAEEILACILSAYNGNDNREVRANNVTIPTSYNMSLNLEFEKLKQYGMISYYTIWITGVWEVTLTPQALTYFDDKVVAQQKEDSIQKGTISIGSIVANGSNFILGDAINSTLSIDNSVQRIENEIKEKGGEDAESLQAVLDEVKELIENMQESRHVPKNKGLFTRISSHLGKHSWFYGEIVGLLGTAAVQMLMG